MQKILERKKFSQKWKTITPDDTTIEERMVFIEERIKEMRMAVLSILFESPSKSEVVTTFMALLELMKKGRSLRNKRKL